MNNWLKKILKITCVVITLPILFCLIVMYFVDPNQYKETLSQKLQEKTGYALQIQGPLQWQLLSSYGLSIKAPDITVSSQSKPKIPLLKAKELNVGVQILPLLAGKLVLDADVIEPTLFSDSKASDLKAKTFSNFHLKAEWIYKEFNKSSDQKLILKNIVFKIQDPELPFTLKGDFQMALKNPYSAEGILVISNKGLMSWLQKFGSNFNPKLNLGEDAHIHFTIKEPFLEITQLNIPFENKGNLSGQFKVDLNKLKQNIFSVQGTLDGQTLEINQIPIASLKSTFNLSAAGKTMDAMKRTLTGQAKIQLNQGKFKGVDLVYLLKHAQTTGYALATSIKQKQLLNIPNALKDEAQYWISQRKQTNKETPFDEARLTLNISNGMIRNDDLFISHKDYQVTGKGNMNLPNYSVEYAALALAKTSDIKEDDKVAKFLKTAEIPIIIKADIQNLNVRPDFTGYMNYILQSSAQEKVETLIDDTLKKLIKIK